MLQHFEQNRLELSFVGFEVERHPPLAALFIAGVNGRSVPAGTLVTDLEEMVHGNRRTECNLMLM